MRPHVRYSYTVGAEHYTSETIAFAAMDTGDPQEDPSVVCIQCGQVGMADYAVTVGGGALALFAVSGLVDLLRGHLSARRRQQRLALDGATTQQAMRG